MSKPHDADISRRCTPVTGLTDTANGEDGHVEATPVNANVLGVVPQPETNTHTISRCRLATPNRGARRN